MTEANDADFYKRRERQERDLASVARDPAIAGIHLDLAEHYASLLRSARKLDSVPAVHSTLRIGANNR